MFYAYTTLKEYFNLSNVVNVSNINLLQTSSMLSFNLLTRLYF